MLERGLSFLYKLLYDVLFWGYMNILYAGRRKFDICSGIIGVSSDHFFGDAGEKICDEKISNTLTYWCNNAVVAMYCYIIFIKVPQVYTVFLKRINRYRKSATYLKAKQTREVKSQLQNFARDVIRIVSMTSLPDAAKATEIKEHLKEYKLLTKDVLCEVSTLNNSDTDKEE